MPGRRALFRNLPTGLAILTGLLMVPPAQAESVVVKDAAGRQVAVADTSRIVSIGGAVTEILYGLGKDKTIVGIDTTSLYPPRAATDKPSVGYMRQLSAEGVLGLRPSLVLAIEGSGPKETMAVLEAAQVPLVVVPDSYSGEGIVKKIDLIARATGASAQGACMVARVRADLAALGRFRSAIHKKKRVLFVLSFVGGRAMVSGRHTAADGIIRMAGAENAIDAYDGYKPISNEAVIAARPDVVLSMQRGGPGAVNADIVFAHPAFSATPAGAAHAFVSMEGLFLLGFGPRSARAARDLAVALYPDLRSAPLPSESAAAPANGCRE
jgi:iron complex transport system substrate-binding protein